MGLRGFQLGVPEMRGLSVQSVRSRPAKVGEAAPFLRPGHWSFAEFIAPIRRFLDTDIALLLATLSILTGSLVTTGVPTKLGAIFDVIAAVIDVGGVISPNTAAKNAKKCPASRWRLAARRHDPRIDAGLYEWRRDHDRDQDIDWRRRQAAAEHDAEDERHPHHGGHVDAGAASTSSANN